MKTILLTGGMGTRISEYTQTIPKPMVPVGGKPILWHIMQGYSHFGFNEFILALGYKSEVIKDYFLRYKQLNSDFTVDLQTGRVSPLDGESVDWRVTLADTGLKTMTGGRIKRLQKHIGRERFMVSYGDGVANVDIEALVKFHSSHGKLATVTAVRPQARFGDLTLENNQVVDFREKTQIQKGWINGGFFVFEPDIFDFIQDDSTLLEREPLEKLADLGELMAYKHSGFWQCMDTKRDNDLLNDLSKTPPPPWFDY